MLCDVCNKNSATVHLTEIISDKVVELHVCQSCARSKDKEVGAQLSISDFLDNFLREDAIDGYRLDLKCSFCGLTLAEVDRRGRLGCHNCYRVFREHLTPLIKKLHSAVRHKGKSPVKNCAVVLPAEPGRDEQLKKQLDRAVYLQEYEEAARLRDEIRKLQND